MSNSEHCVPPIAIVDVVGVPSKHTEQKTVPGEAVGVDGAAGAVGPEGEVGSFGHPHVFRANACAIPHCSKVNPGPNGPPIAWAWPHVSPNPILGPNPNNNASPSVNTPPSRQILHVNRTSKVGVGAEVTTVVDVGTTTGCGVVVVGDNGGVGGGGGGGDGKDTPKQPHGSSLRNALDCNNEHVVMSYCR